MEKTREITAFQAQLDFQRFRDRQRKESGQSSGTDGILILFEQVEANRKAIEELRDRIEGHRHSLPHKPNGPFAITSEPIQ